jgi:hypothetical protein
MTCLTPSDPSICKKLRTRPSFLDPSREQIAVWRLIGALLTS